jgi:anti-sigma B factor antagonist
VPGIRYPLMINGVAVVSAPAEIDVTTAGQLRMVLLDAGRHGHATVVVDMTRTRFCDSAGLAVLAGAHRRALAQGGGLRLVLPAGGAVARILSFTGLDGFLPGFDSLEHALAPGPAAAIPPSRPRPAGRRSPARRPAMRLSGGDLVADTGMT